jgi:hypothetical protein
MRVDIDICFALVSIFILIGLYLKLERKKPEKWEISKQKKALRENLESDFDAHKKWFRDGYENYTSEEIQRWNNNIDPKFYSIIKYLESENQSNISLGNLIKHLRNIKKRIGKIRKICSKKGKIADFYQLEEEIGIMEREIQRIY